MKKITLGLVLLISTVAMSQKDPKAKLVLDGVSTKFKSLSTVQASFQLTVTNRGKKAGTKTGKVFMKGPKYKIDDKQFKIFCDGKSIWKHEPEANEYSVSAVDNNVQAITPQKLFTNFYDKDFNYKLNGDKTVGGKKLTEIEMTPTDTRKGFDKVFIYVDKAQNIITAAKVLDDSNVYEYSITGIVTNKTIADNTFTFNPAAYPGIEKIN